jgi:DNA-directed RNA polymerase specialized sigma24 family protein
MPPTPPDSGLKYLDRLYGLAKIFSYNEPQARRLVERAYTQVADEDQKADLLNLLRGLARGAEAMDSDREPSTDDKVGGQSTDVDRPLFRTEALSIARRALGPALADLSAREQLAIVLVEVQGLHADQLAIVFDCSPMEALSLHQKALARLVGLVMKQLNPVQLGFTLDHLPDSWIGQTLESLAWQQEQRAPDPLRTRIAARMGPTVGAAQSRKKEQVRPARAPGFGRRVRNTFLGATLIVLLGTLSYQIAGLAVRQPETNAIQLTAISARSFSPSLLTASRSEAAAFFDAAGKSVDPPEVAGAELEGVGLAELSPGIRIPTLRYSDRASGDAVTIYGLTYRDLDRYAGVVDLPDDVLRQIQNDLNYDLHPLDEDQVLVWRRGAWIFLAVSSIEGSELRERIYAPEG